MGNGGAETKRRGTGKISDAHTTSFGFTPRNEDRSPTRLSLQRGPCTIFSKETSKLKVISPPPPSLYLCTYFSLTYRVTAGIGLAALWRSQALGHLNTIETAHDAMPISRITSASFFTKSPVVIRFKHFLGRQQFGEWTPQCAYSTFLLIKFGVLSHRYANYSPSGLLVC
jgi:hypothetical protein